MRGKEDGNAFLPYKPQNNVANSSRESGSSPLVRFVHDEQLCSVRKGEGKRKLYLHALGKFFDLLSFRQIELRK